MQEKDIIRKIKNGEIQYIDYVVSSYYGQIYSYLCRKMGDEFEAQDVTQEVFTKFFANLHTYQERGKLQNYLFKLATNASNDVFRKRKTVAALSEVGELEDKGASPWDKVQTREDGEMVKQALQTLPVNQREVIILRFYHELSFGDIARITDSNLSTVKTRFRRGMQTLKEILEVGYER